MLHPTLCKQVKENAHFWKKRLVCAVEESSLRPKPLRRLVLHGRVRLASSAVGAVASRSQPCPTPPTSSPLPLPPRRPPPASSTPRLLLTIRLHCHNAASRTLPNSDRSKLRHLRRTQRRRREDRPRGAATVKAPETMAIAAAAIGNCRQKWGAGE